MRADGIIKYLSNCADLGQKPILNQRDARVLVERFKAMTEALARATSEKDAKNA